MRLWFIIRIGSSIEITGGTQYDWIPRFLEILNEGCPPGKPAGGVGQSSARLHITTGIAVINQLKGMIGVWLLHGRTSYDNRESDEK
jgi:hypothetical protein